MEFTKTLTSTEMTPVSLRRRSAGIRGKGLRLGVGGTKSESRRNFLTSGMEAMTRAKGEAGVECAIPGDDPPEYESGLEGTPRPSNPGTAGGGKTDKGPIEGGVSNRKGEASALRGSEFSGRTAIRLD